MSFTKDNWDVRRTQISKAAAMLIRKKGFNASSMEDLAKKVRIRKATIYHYFSSKQELLYHTLIEAVGGALSRVEEIVEADLSAKEKLRLFLIDHIESIVANLEPVTVFLEEGRYLRNQYREKYIALRDEYEQLLRAILKEGMAKREFRKVDPKLCGFAILGMCNWIVRWYTPGGGLSAHDIAVQYADIVEKGLLEGEPRCKALETKIVSKKPRRG